MRLSLWMFISFHLQAREVEMKKYAPNHVSKLHLGGAGALVVFIASRTLTHSRFSCPVVSRPCIHSKLEIFSYLTVVVNHLHFPLPSLPSCSSFHFIRSISPLFTLLYFLSPPSFSSLHPHILPIIGFFRICRHITKILARVL